MKNGDHDAKHRLAVAYANRYHVGMSSLGFQRVVELVHRRPDWIAERFFTDPDDHVWEPFWMDPAAIPPAD